LLICLCLATHVLAQQPRIPLQYNQFSSIVVTSDASGSSQCAHSMKWFAQRRQDSYSDLDVLSGSCKGDLVSTTFTNFETKTTGVVYPNGTCVFNFISGLTEPSREFQGQFVKETTCPAKHGSTVPCNLWTGNITRPNENVNFYVDTSSNMYPLMIDSISTGNRHVLLGFTEEFNSVKYLQPPPSCFDNAPNGLLLFTFKNVFPIEPPFFSKAVLEGGFSGPQKIKSFGSQAYVILDKYTGRASGLASYRFPKFHVTLIWQYERATGIGTYSAFSDPNFPLRVKIKQLSNERVEWSFVLE